MEKSVSAILTANLTPLGRTRPGPCWRLFNQCTWPPSPQLFWQFRYQFQVICAQICLQNDFNQLKNGFNQLKNELNPLTDQLVTPPESPESPEVDSTTALLESKKPMDWSWTISGSTSTRPSRVSFTIHQRQMPRKLHQGTHSQPKSYLSSNRILCPVTWLAFLNLLKIFKFKLGARILLLSIITIKGIVDRPYFDWEMFN